MPDEIDAFLDAPAPQQRDDIDDFLDAEQDGVDAFLAADAGSLDEFVQAEQEQPERAGIIKRFIKSKPVQFAITPIPALSKAKSELQSMSKRSIKEVRRGIPKTAEPTSVVGHVLRSVRNAIIPIPTEEMAERLQDAIVPIAPLDLAAEGAVAVGVVGDMVKRLRLARKAEVVAKQAKKISVAEATARLEDIAKQANSGPEPLIKIATAAESRGAIKEASDLHRSLPSKVSPQAGLVRTRKAVEALDASIADNIAAGKELSSDQQHRVFEQVSELVESGEIDSGAAARLLGIEGPAKLDPVQMAKTIREVASEQGRALNRWSRIARKLREKLPPDSEAGKILGSADEFESDYAFITNAYKYLDNIRRASMTAQFTTTARNIISQFARSGFAVAEDASNAVAGIMTGKIGARQGWDVGTAHIASFAKALRPGSRKEILKILDSFPTQKEKLLRTPIGDVSMDQRIAALLNTFNSTQEHFFRAASFDAHLRQSLALKGKTLMNVSKMKPGALNKSVQDAVNHALEMTFAKSPDKTTASGKVGTAILDIYNAFPFMTALGNPFPRFWMNALRFAWEFSPHQMLNPATYRAMASADPRVAFQGISRAFLGSAMWGVGFAADWSGKTGDRWYQLKVDESEVDPLNPSKEVKRFFDVRPFAPFAAPFFMGRLMSRGMRHTLDAMGRSDLHENGMDLAAIRQAFEEMSGEELDRAVSEGVDRTFLQVGLQDWTQAFFSMRRTDAFGLPVLELFTRSSNMRTFRNESERLVANWLGGFTVAARSAEDIIAGVQAKLSPDSVLHSREGLLARTSRLDPIKQSAMANVPFLRRKLPRAPQALRGEIVDGQLVEGTRELTSPIQRQFLGFNLSGTTIVEAEADRLGVKGRDIYPKTGMREYDDLIVRNMGPIIAETHFRLVSSDQYQAIPFKLQRTLFKQLLNHARKASKEIVDGKRPDLAMRDLLNRADDLMAKDLEKAFQESGLVGEDE